MESMKDGMQQVMRRYLYMVEVPCSYCGKPMLAWREKEGEQPRSAPVCVECGYKSNKKEQQKQSAEMYERSLKAQTFKRFKYSSVLTDKNLLECSMTNYKEIDETTTEAKRMAMRACEAILNDKSIHVVFSGRTGVGKSHLSIAMLKEVMEKSDYKKSCLFINYRELLEQLKFAMSDNEVKKQVHGSLMNDIKEVDVLVLDDLAAELGLLDNNKPATTYSIDVLTSITEARQNKATIFTTNLTSKQLKSSYGDRVTSRILNNAQGYMLSITNTKDKRQHRIS